MYRIRLIGDIPENYDPRVFSSRSQDLAHEKFGSLIQAIDLQGKSVKALLTRFHKTVVEFDFSDPYCCRDTCLMALTMLPAPGIEGRIHSRHSATELRQMAGARSVKLSQGTAQFAEEFGDGSIIEGISRALRQVPATAFDEMKSAPRHKLRLVSANLSMEEVDKASLFGDGNVSAGVRNALYFLLSQIQ